MSRKTGIWIDLSKAVIVDIRDQASSLITIHSGIETKKREAGEGADSGRFGNQYLTQEKTKKNKLDQEIQRFLKEVSSGLKGSEGLVIFGPANMKTELQKTLHKSNDFKDIQIEVVTTDAMTDNQTVAWVKKHFSVN